MALSIHPITKRNLESAQAHAPHGVLLYGKNGVGLRTLAKKYFETSSVVITEVLPEKNEKIDLEKGSITIESIRRLYDTVKTSVPEGRIVIIDYAERMGTPAQNAFLKLLEEPPRNTRFVLLSHTPESLLPTIWSRVQAIEVRAVSLEQSEELLTSLKVNDATKRAQLLFIAKGLPAELSRLAADEKEFSDRVAVIKDARTFVTGSAYDRLLLAKKYKDSRANALLLLQDASQQVTATIAKTGSDRVLKTLDTLEKAHKRITEQGNIRLQLSALVAL